MDVLPRVGSSFTGDSASSPRRGARRSSPPARSARRSLSSFSASGRGRPPRKKETRGVTLFPAGAIGSPQLLQLSGIGAGASLKKNGIEVVHALPGVGENLQDHLQIRMQYKVKNVKTLNGIANSLFGKAAMALEYFVFRTGPLTMPPSHASAVARSDPAQPTPNIEWHVQPLSLDKFGDPLHSFPAITPSVCNLRPSSRGSVRIKSPAAPDYPEIKLNYLKSEEDRKVAVD